MCIAKTNGVLCSLIPRPLPSFPLLVVQLTVLQATDNGREPEICTASNGKCCLKIHVGPPPMSNSWPPDVTLIVHAWQSQIEIKYYSVTYFEHITEFDAL